MAVHAGETVSLLGRIAVALFVGGCISVVASLVIGFICVVWEVKNG
jgi:hypothetical protein